MTRKISNSEVTDFNTCEYRYYLSYDLGLEPKIQPKALFRGIIGHDCLDAYYQHFIGLMPGQKTDDVYEKAEAAAWVVLSSYIASAPNFYVDIVVDLRRVLARYFKYAKESQRDWIILASEKMYELDLVEDFSYSCRVDLVARIDGLVTVVDHKFVYDFWSMDDLDINPQLPKYVGILRNNGIQIDRAKVNQIRYRVLKTRELSDEEMFRLDDDTPTTIEVQKFLREQILTSRRIVEHRERPLPVREMEAIRVLNKMVCKSCPVRSLCIESLKGQDINNTIAMDYQTRTYGYNDRVITEVDSGY